MRSGRRTPAEEAAPDAPRPLQGASPGERIISMTSTEAQNGFGRVLDSVARNRTVLITRHNAAQAVVISVERYEELTRASRPDLDALAAEFDSLLARLQTPGARAGLREAFGASPDELAQAAVAAARSAGE